MTDPCKKTPSPVSRPASKAGGSQTRPKEAVFNTITSDDWKRSIASGRRRKNAVSEQIQTLISSSSPKTK